MYRTGLLTSLLLLGWAAGPLVVGLIAAGGLGRTMGTISLVALVPLVGLLLVPLVIETRGRSLLD